MTALGRILFITLSNVGDVIMTLPVLDVLRGNYPDAKVTVLVGPRALELFAGSRSVDEVIVYDKEIGWMDKWLLVKELRRYQFDLVVDLRNTAFPYLLNAPYRTSLLRFHLRRIASKREQHLACLESVARQVDLTLEARCPFDFFSERDQESVQEKLRSKGWQMRDLVVVAPGAASSLKRWYVEGFARLCERLVREQRKRVLLVGGRSDMPVVDEIVARSREDLMDLAGETTLRELACLLKEADLLVSNDSAALQMAYELEIPSVGIFGPTDEKKYGRQNEISTVVRKSLPCAPCESAKCLIPKIKACLLEIDPDEVYEACARILSRAESLRNVPASV